MQRIWMNRKVDETGISGEGIVWEGVVFDNMWIAGKWISDFPSYGWYPDMSALMNIHGHNGATKIENSDRGRLINVVANDSSIITDGNTVVAQGYIADDGWVALLFLARYTSVYWYRNLDELIKISGTRSHITDAIPNKHYHLDDPIWLRDTIYK